MVASNAAETNHRHPGPMSTWPKSLSRPQIATMIAAAPEARLNPRNSAAWDGPTSRASGVEAPAPTSESKHLLE